MIHYPTIAEWSAMTNVQKADHIDVVAESYRDGVHRDNLKLQAKELREKNDASMV